MEELTKMVDKLKKALNQKEEMLNQKQERNEYDWGLFKNRQTDIKNFQNAIGKINNNPFLKKTIIINLAIEADKILKEIEQIK